MTTYVITTGTPRFSDLPTTLTLNDSEKYLTKSIKKIINLNFFPATSNFISLCESDEKRIVFLKQIALFMN